MIFAILYFVLGFGFLQMVKEIFPERERELETFKLSSFIMLFWIVTLLFLGFYLLFCKFFDKEA